MTTAAPTHRSRRLALAGCALGACVALAGCGGTSSPSTSAAGASPLGASTSPSSNQPCPTATPSVAHPQQFSAPPTTVSKSAYTMTITIACKGPIVIAMDAGTTPATVNSFAFLASHHWFDNTPCHRLVTSGIYVLQCGDPTGTGSGGPGYTIPDENLKGATYPAGTVAMANTGRPHTGGSQFFLVYADSRLPPQYTPFGHVVSGMDVLNSIASAGENDSNGPGDGQPNKPVVISSLTVTAGSSS
jgi:peptidyl-prolyl cis-trans isomerase B (cyclophilin B)